jgi:hypothetical protein
MTDQTHSKGEEAMMPLGIMRWDVDGWQCIWCVIDRDEREYGRGAWNPFSSGPRGTVAWFWSRAEAQAFIRESYARAWDRGASLSADELRETFENGA